MSTTIRIDKKVRDKLDKLKMHPGETYNKLVQRLIDLGTDKGELSEDTRRDIERSLEEVRAGRTLSMNEVKKRLKMK